MTQENKPQISVSGVLQDLKDGLTRDGIAEKYGISKAAVKRLFKHPQLKNKKTIKPREEEFILVDDVTETTDQAAPETAEETVAEAQEEVSEESEEAQDESVSQSDSTWQR